MALVTLIGEKQNKTGFEFVYNGPTNMQFECRDCKLKAVCFNLEEGRTYKVVKARDIHHDCKVHEEGVRAVEVERIAVSMALPAKVAVEGATIAYQPIECKNLACEYYRLCHPWGLKPEQKLKITKMSNEINCDEGHKLVNVLID
jgi:uncharacterized protein (UPF0179 family)